MVIAVAVLLGLVWAIARRRRAVKDRRAGLIGTAPTYQVAPPTRYSTSRRDHQI